MKVIAHRALTETGCKKENTIEAINECIDHRIYAEVDIRYDPIGNLWALGHDRGEYTIQDIKSFFTEYGKACIFHAKTISTFAELINNYLSYNLEFFFHDQDECTLTYNRWIWLYPGKKPMVNGSIVVLPESQSVEYQQEVIDNMHKFNLFGVCTKFPLTWKSRYNGVTV